MDTSERDNDNEKRPLPDEPFTDEHPDTHLDREDKRWGWQAQRRDWMILLALIITYLVWTGVIYFLEPGIR